MLGHLYEGEICSAARALEVVGERWSLLILRNAMFAGHTRFTEFQRALGVAPNVLAKRLSSFVEAGLFELHDGEYSLTEKGLDLKPAILALTEWGDRYACDEMGRPVVYRHGDDCGGEVAVSMTCADCNDPVPSSDVVADVAPWVRERKYGAAQA